MFGKDVRKQKQNDIKFGIRFVCNEMQNESTELLTLDLTHKKKILFPTQVALNGAILILNIIFACELDEEKCAIKVESANVDSKSGYLF